MNVLVETPPRVAFDAEDFDRAWRDADAPAPLGVVPQTSIVLGRNSAFDFQDRQIYVWIDEQPYGKIRYGESLSYPVEPGPHTIKVFNTMFTRALRVEAAPGEQVKVQCGTGMPTAGWLLMIFLHVTYLRVWIEKEQ